MARPVTEGIHAALMMDGQLSPAQCCDFGVKTDDHYRALQRAVREGASVVKLDACLGNGQMLTDLCRRYTPDCPAFHTAYDEIEGRA